MLKKVLAFGAVLLATVSFAAVEVNTASPTELESVKGIGPSLSGRIVDERKNGEFKGWEDFIERVKGVGQKNAVRLSDEGVTVKGQPYKAGASSAQAGKPAK